MGLINYFLVRYGRNEDSGPPGPHDSMKGMELFESSDYLELALIVFTANGISDSARDLDWIGYSERFVEFFDRIHFHRVNALNQFVVGLEPADLL